MKILFTVVVTTLIISLASTLFAEDWELASDANLALTQNTYSNSWVGGEIGSFIWVFNSNSHAEKQFNPKFHNKTTLKLSFGQTRNQDRETKEWSKPEKSTDLIDFETFSRFTLGWFVDPFVAGRVESQFLDASDADKERFLNPVTLIETLGVAKVLIKNEEEKRDWTARLGGGVRQHLNRDMLVVDTNKRETEFSNDGGFEFVSEFKTPLLQKRITFNSKLIVFQSLFYSKSDELKGQENENYWRYPDVNWENIFSASITKYLMVNLYVQILYDKEIDPDARFKQTLSLGLTYKLI